MARLFSLLTFLVVATGVFAQEARFHIERIEVRGTRFTSASVIAKQTLLREGETYTEAQIKAAIDRVNRLPFVVDAEPALEKGSQREQYVLAIIITEIKPLFVDAHSNYSRLLDNPRSSWSDESGVETGARFFLGSTLVHASTDFRGTYNAGVTQYDLFGTPAWASANVRLTDRRTINVSTDPSTGATTRFVFEQDPGITLLLGVPINNNNSIQVTWSHGSGTSQTTFHGETTEMHQSGQSATAAWVYDSTDDALFPTRGTTARGGVFATRSSVGLGGVPDFQQQVGFVEGRHYWNFSGQQSVNAGANVSLIHTPRQQFLFNNENDNAWVVSAGYSTSLWPRKQTIRYGDLRFETMAGFSSTSQVSGYRYATLTSGVAFRNPWGLLRFNVAVARTVNQ